MILETYYSADKVELPDDQDKSVNVAKVNGKEMSVSVFRTKYGRLKKKVFHPQK